MPLVDDDEGEEDVEELLPLLRLPRDERLDRPVLLPVELLPEVVEDIEPPPMLPPLIDPLPIAPVEPIDPVDPIDPEDMPPVPDCAPLMLPLAPAEPDPPAAPDEPAPPPAEPPPPADCAMTATGVSATAAAMIINFRMILSVYSVRR